MENKKNTRHEVSSKDEAWALAGELFGSDWMEDASSSERAGYPIYRSTADANSWISDLNTRLELNMADGSTINIWIEERKYTAEEVKSIISEARKELETIEKFFEVVKESKGSRTASDVMTLLLRKRSEYKRALKTFGL